MKHGRLLATAFTLLAGASLLQTKGLTDCDGRGSGSVSMSELMAGTVAAGEQARKDNDKVLENALVDFKKYAPVQAKFEFVYMPEGFKMYNYAPKRKGICQQVCKWITSLVCETVCKTCKPDCHNQLVESCCYIKK